MLYGWIKLFFLYLRTRQISFSDPLYNSPPPPPQVKRWSWWVDEGVCLYFCSPWRSCTTCSGLLTFAPLKVIPMLLINCWLCNQGTWVAFTPFPFRMYLLTNFLYWLFSPIYQFFPSSPTHNVCIHTFPHPIFFGYSWQNFVFRDLFPMFHDTDVSRELFKKTNALV